MYPLSWFAIPTSMICAMTIGEWKEDLMAYISEKSDVYKPYLVTTKKEIRILVRMIHITLKWKDCLERYMFR